jgi:pentatricopeptide repeat protein
LSGGADRPPARGATTGAPHQLSLPDSSILFLLQVPTAFRMFEELQAMGAIVDVVTGTTLMSASNRQGKPELCLAMLAEMRAAGLPLDTVVLNLIEPK